MDRKSTKYIVLWSAVLSVMALNTTRINAEETPGTVATAQPTVTATAAPVETPATTSTPAVAPATPAATPAGTPAASSAPAESSVVPATSPATSNEIAQNKVTVRHGSMKLAVQARPTGEQLENGHWTYIDETTHQKVINSFKYLDSSKKTVYYDENGYMVYGLRQINGKEYYFLPDSGAMFNGEKKINGHYYHFDKNNGGAASTGVTNLGYKTVLYADNGQMLYGLQNYKGKLYYLTPGNGAMVFGEKKVNGHYYHFDKNNGGAASTGVTNLGYKTVLYADNGQMLYGLQNYKGRLYYLMPGTGAQFYGEKKINGHYYHFDKNNSGAASTGVTNLGYKTVLYADNGQMLYGLQNYKGKLYYLTPGNGAMVFGEKKVNGHYYHFDKNNGGAASTGVTNLGYKTVYYNQDGMMLYGKQPYTDQNGQKHFIYLREGTGELIKFGWYKSALTGLTYYVNKDGYLLSGEQEIGNGTYYFAPDSCAAQYGWVASQKAAYTKDGRKLVNLSGKQSIDGKTYYFDESTHIPVTGFHKGANNNVYYFGSDGVMVLGEKKVNGHYYYFDRNTGAMATGLTNLGYKTVYYNANGTMFYGEKKVNGHYYYFRPGTGAMATGLTNLGYKTVYYNANGTMFYGEKKINGYYYYFKPGTGAMATGLTNLGYKMVYYDNYGRMVHHDFDLNGVHYSVNSVTGEAKVAVYHHGTVPYMKQTDPRWANRRYGGMTMASTACGVTTIAMNLTAWKGYTILPPTVADYLHSVGEYNGRSAGTTGYSRIAAGNHWSLRVDKITSLQQMKTALAQGKTISEMSGAGYFSNGSHGITIFGNSNGYATAYDPYNSRNNGTYSINYLWNARSKDPADYDAGAVIFAYYR